MPVRRGSQRNRKQNGGPERALGFAAAIVGVFLPLTVRDVDELSSDNRADRRLVSDGDIAIQDFGAHDAPTGGIDHEAHDARRRDAVLDSDDGATVPGDPVTANRRRAGRVIQTRDHTGIEIHAQQTVRVVGDVERSPI